jgi:hypothetical protein
MARIKQILIAFDQLINALLGGWADETLSSRAWRESAWLAALIDALFWFDKDHCFESYVSEQLRMQAPPELRNSLSNGEHVNA